MYCNFPFFLCKYYEVSMMNLYNKIGYPILPHSLKIQHLKCIYQMLQQGMEQQFKGMNNLI